MMCMLYWYDSLLNSFACWEDRSSMFAVSHFRTYRLMPWSPTSSHHLQMMCVGCIIMQCYLLLRRSAPACSWELSENDCALTLANPGLRRFKILFCFWRSSKQDGRAGIKASIRIEYAHSTLCWLARALLSLWRGSGSKGLLSGVGKKSRKKI